MVKFTRRATAHFVMLTVNGMHLIMCISGHICHFWREIQTMKVIKCPTTSNSVSQRQNSCTKPNLKRETNTIANLNVKNVICLMGLFVTVIKTEHASNLVHFPEHQCQQ